MERETYWIKGNGIKVFITDVRDTDSFKGNWWVDLDSGNSPTTVEHFETYEAAEEKAKELVSVLQ